MCETTPKNIYIGVAIGLEEVGGDWEITIPK